MNNWWKTWAEVVAQALAERWSKLEQERDKNQENSAKDSPSIDEAKPSITDAETDQESTPPE